MAILDDEAFLNEPPPEVVETVAPLVEAPETVVETPAPEVQAVVETPAVEPEAETPASGETVELPNQDNGVADESISLPKLKADPEAQLKVIKNKIQEWVFEHMLIEDMKMAEEINNHQKTKHSTK